MQRPPLLFIVAGERGFKAAQQVGVSTVPGICVEASTQPGRVGGGWKANYQGLTPFTVPRFAVIPSSVVRSPVVRGQWSRFGNAPCATPEILNF